LIQLAMSSGDHVLQDVTVLLATKWKTTVLTELYNTDKSRTEVFQQPLENLLKKDKILSENLLALLSHKLEIEQNIHGKINLSKNLSESLEKTYYDVLKSNPENNTKLNLLIILFSKIAKDVHHSKNLLQSAVVSIAWSDILKKVVENEKTCLKILIRYLELIINLARNNPLKICDHIILDDLTLSAQNNKLILPSLMKFFTKLLEILPEKIMVRACLNLYTCHHTNMEEEIFKTITSENYKNSTSLGSIIKILTFLLQSWREWSTSAFEVFKSVKITITGVLNLILALPLTSKSEKTSKTKMIHSPIIANGPISIRRRQSSSTNPSNISMLGDSYQIDSLKIDIITLCLEGLVSCPRLIDILDDNVSNLGLFSREVSCFVEPNFSTPKLSIENGKIVGVNDLSFGSIVALFDSIKILNQSEDFRDELIFLLLDRVWTIFISQTYLIMDDLDANRREELSSEMSTILKRLQTTFLRGYKSFMSPGRKTKSPCLNTSILRSNSELNTTLPTKSADPSTCILFSIAEKFLDALNE